MIYYVLRRLLLVPITLFFIILVNFVIINLAPGEPTSITEISPDGATRKEKDAALVSDDRYLQFREFYGLTLPILLNTWPWTSDKYVHKTLWQLTYRKKGPDSSEMSAKDYDQLKISFGDRSRFIMEDLLKIVEDVSIPEPIRQTAFRFFIRGGTKQGYVGPHLTKTEKKWNQKIAKNQMALLEISWKLADTPKEREEKVLLLRNWYENNKDDYHFVLTPSEKWKAFFFETRFATYMKRVLTLDFGTLRNDYNKTVTSEVIKRFKYSLTLSVLPMFITFFLCQVFGFFMAYNQSRWPDFSLNVLFLILYAIPVFVVAPFLIEKIALYHYFPFTNIPIPISGFTSREKIYETLTSYERLLDVASHIFLPILSIIYGMLAAQSRLCRTAVLEVKRLDFIRTAFAKGLPKSVILIKHVGKNAAITIVTSLAGSLGIILGGSLIVETVFDINGFGKFFYDAVVNRDYNVIMFSAIAGSFLSLMGYLIADLTYTWLDPRVSLESE